MAADGTKSTTEAGTPTDSEASIGLLARDLHRVFNRALDRSVGRFGLAAHTTRYLAVIADMGGASPSELSKYFGVRSPTTLAALQVLEQKRLIVRNKDPNDKRRTIFQVTKQGSKINTLALDCVREIESAAVRDLSPTDVVKFRELTVAIRKSLRAKVADDDLAAGDTSPETEEAY